MAAPQPDRKKLTQNAYALYEAICDAHAAICSARGMGDVAAALKILDDARASVAPDPKAKHSFRMTPLCARRCKTYMRASDDLRPYLDGLEIKETRCYLRVTFAKNTLGYVAEMFHELGRRAGKNKVKAAFSRLEDEATEALKVAPMPLELLAHESD